MRIILVTLLLLTNCSRYIEDPIYKITHENLTTHRDDDTLILKKEDKPNNQVQLAASISAPTLECGKAFDLYTVNLLNKSNYMGEFIVNDNHELEMDNTTYKFCFQNHMPGEPMSITIISKDQTESYSIKFIPDPLVITWRDGAKVEMEMLTSNAECFSIEGSNFKPDEIIKYCSRNHGEVMGREIEIDSSGKFIMILLTDVGAKHVWADVDVTRYKPNSTKTLHYFHGF